MADTKGLGTRPTAAHSPITYLDDDRLSLEAKGLLSIIVNHSYEQVCSLAYSNDLNHPLKELCQHGYVGRLTTEVFEVRPTFTQGGRHV